MPEALAEVPWTEALGRDGEVTQPYSVRAASGHQDRICSVTDFALIDEPRDGLPVIEAATIAGRAYLVATVAQAKTDRASHQRHLAGLIERAGRWRLSAELRSRLVAEGLLEATP